MTINADEFGDLIVRNAAQFDGACACAPFRPRMYEAVGMAFDPEPFHVDADGRVHGMSTCYRFAHNVYDLSGVALPNWHMGEPIGTVIVWAKRNGCWQPAGDGLRPSRGDMLVIGKLGGTHVCIVEGFDGDTINTIDAGQVCRRKGEGHDGQGRQMVARRSRVWRGDSVVGTQTDPVVGWVVSGICLMKLEGDLSI